MEIIDDLKDARDLDEVWDIAESRLIVLGQGGSRAVFALDEGTVVKLATIEEAPENRIEWRVGSDPRFVDFVPVAIDHHPAFWWIAVERVEPVFDSREVIDLPEEAVGEFLTGADEVEALEGLRVTPAQLRFLRRWKRFVRAAGITQHALMDHQEWGRAHDGRIVLMDFE